MARVTFYRLTSDGHVPYNGCIHSRERPGMRAHHDAMIKYPIYEPETFHLRMRILAMAGIPFRQVGQEVELDQALDRLPTTKQALVKAALECHLEWRQLQGLTAKEKVAVGVAAMDVARHRASRMLPV